MPKRKRQQATEDDAVTETHHTNGKAEEQKPPKRAAPTKRKSKAEQEAELVEMPLAQRTLGQKLNIGAHVSAAGGEHRGNRSASESGAKSVDIK